MQYSGSLRYFLDKLTGKAPDRQEELDRKVRQAKAVQENLESLLESLNRDLEELAAEREQLPAWDSFCTAENRREWAALERKLCAEALLPLLEQTEAALEDYRRLLRGELTAAGERYEQATNHIFCAENCTHWLRRLKNAGEILEEPFDAGGYFENPAAFIDGAAARHNRIDRVSQALGQVRKLRKSLHS